MTLRGKKVATLVASLGLVMSLAFSVSSLFPVAADASIGNPTCPHSNGTPTGGNYQSAACYYGVVQYGTYSEFHNNTMDFIGQQGANLENQGWHINNTIWAYSGSPCADWIEIGDTQGSGPGNQPPYGAGYFYYWAYDNATGYHGQIIGASDNSGNNHSYELLYLGNGTYRAYLDFNSNNYTATGMGAGSCTSQSGLELSGYDQGGDNLQYQHSDTFYHYPLEWEDTGGTWHSGWNTNDFWIDHPCGQQGYTQPDCINGQWVSSNDYGANKP